MQAHNMPADRRSASTRNCYGKAPDTASASAPLTVILTPTFGGVSHSVIETVAPSIDSTKLRNSTPSTLLFEQGTKTKQRHFLNSEAATRDHAPSSCQLVGHRGLRVRIFLTPAVFWLCRLRQKRREQTDGRKEGAHVIDEGDARCIC